MKIRDWLIYGSLALVGLTLSSCKRSDSMPMHIGHLQNDKITRSIGPLESLTNLFKENNEFMLFEQRWEIRTTIIDTPDILSFKNSVERLRYSVRGAYQKSDPPYPGVVSKKEECSTEYLPKFYFDLNLPNLDLFSVAGRGSSQGVLGACDSNSAKTTVMEAVIQCHGAKEVVEMHISGPYPNVPLDSFAEVLRSFRCTTAN